MSVKIRLTRTGKKKQPHYRVVIADSRSPRDGRFLEQVGSYNPRSKSEGSGGPVELKLKTDRVIHWLEKGARPTETVSKLLKSQGLWPRESSGKGAKAASKETTA